MGYGGACAQCGNYAPDSGPWWLSCTRQSIHDIAIDNEPNMALSIRWGGYLLHRAKSSCAFSSDAPCQLLQAQKNAQLWGKSCHGPLNCSVTFLLHKMHNNLSISSFSKLEDVSRLLNIGNCNPSLTDYTVVVDQARQCRHSTSEGISQSSNYFTGMSLMRAT